MNAEAVWAVLFLGSAMLNLHLVDRLIKSSWKYAEFKLWQQQNGEDQ